MLENLLENLLSPLMPVRQVGRLRGCHLSVSRVHRGRTASSSSAVQFTLWPLRRSGSARAMTAQTGRGEGHDPPAGRVLGVGPNQWTPG